MTKRRQIEVYDTPSGMGGSFTVEIIAHLDHERVKVRVWYGRATPKAGNAGTNGTAIASRQSKPSCATGA
ncbi:hypothetical protein HED55_27200 [Ochrobactrum haematophilum]|uniref:Uncharacterized protein n=1 Tax=Brucella haematophila TaxID=419474 RepID=A0ABX1DRB7_9HYPH|nr:hypothetical protein [Brucella haematophila]